jgi:phosphatidylserine/phosphatidylglycerophosphate/cardiolipin synthase-like enzyme
MEAKPDLQVELLLNIQRRPGDRSSVDSLINEYANKLWREEWPGSRRPKVYYDPRSLDPEAKGVLHAKAVIADEKSLLVSSANLTEHAFDHNFELGLLVRNELLAKSARHHFQLLIDRKLLLKLPA